MQAHIQSWHSINERLRSYRLEQRSGATGEGSDYGKNGRATSEGAESGVSGGRKLKRLGSTAEGGGEYARHNDGGGGRCHIMATGAIRGGRSEGIMGWK